MSIFLNKKLAVLYHGSDHKIEGPLIPVVEKKTPDHVHDRAAVFATERADLAALFMFPLEVLHSIGFEKGIAYICIWGTSEEFFPKDRGGFLYVLPATNFEKIGKEYEWQSFEPVLPVEIRRHESVIKGMMQYGVQVYFIDDDNMFDQIRDNKDNRLPILKNLKLHKL